MWYFIPPVLPTCHPRPPLPSPQGAHTQAAGKPLELDEAVPVLIQEAEGPVGEELGVLPAGPGREQAVEAGELPGVDAVLLGVRPAGVVPLRHRAPAALPVAPDQMFPLGEIGDTRAVVAGRSSREHEQQKRAFTSNCAVTCSKFLCARCHSETKTIPV